ncbi:MAG: RNA methyltransferase [Chloroflexi bacterium]|nr:RNA methyltransferase [Chloroflexota bacterium]
MFSTQLDCFPDAGATVRYLRQRGCQIIAASLRGAEI